MTFQESLRKRKREGLCHSGLGAVIKKTEDKGEGEGEKGKGKGYLSQRDSGLPLIRKKTDLEHGKMVLYKDKGESPVLG